MTIEIQEPELEALIAQRMESGAFKSVEDVLLQALKAAPTPPYQADLKPARSGLTGKDLIAVLQSIPEKDFDFRLERFPSYAREPEKL